MSFELADLGYPGHHNLDSQNPSRIVQNDISAVFAVSLTILHIKFENTW